MGRDARSIQLKRSRDSFLKRYGVVNPVYVPEFAAKKASTMRDRYGAENPFCKESSLYSSVQSVWDGKDRTAHLPKDNFSRPEIKEKIRNYWQSHYGVQNPTQVPEIRSKQLATFLTLYGDEQGLRVPSIREKGRATMLARYGVPNAAQSPEILEKIRAANLKRYGVPWTTLGSSRDKQYATQIQKYGTLFFGSERGKAAVRRSLLESENVPADGIRRRPLRMNSFEKTVHSACQSLLYVGNGSYWRYLPGLLGSKNPDFVVPGPDPLHPLKNVSKVVECLGVYWHSLDKTGLHRDDYEMLLKQCWLQVGVSCLVIWEDETWGDLAAMSAKITSFLEDDIPPPKEVVPSVDFQLSDIAIGPVSVPDSFSFLNSYHYAGYGRSAVFSIAARLDTTIIAILKFARPIRQNVSTSFGLEDSSILELDRMCVHPSFQKKNLLSFVMARSIKILRETHPEVVKLVSFSDPSEGHTGTVYRAANWQEVGKTSSSYFYVLPSGIKMNKKTLFNKARSSGMNERAYAEHIGACRIPTPPKLKFAFDLR